MNDNDLGDKQTAVGERSEPTDGAEVARAERVRQSAIVFIDFFANWCGPCKAQDPIIEYLESKYEGIVDFKKVDVNKEEELSDRYNVREIPTLIIEKDGKLLARYVGLTSIYILEKKLKEIIGKRKIEFYGQKH